MCDIFSSPPASPSSGAPVRFPTMGCSRSVSEILILDEIGLPLRGVAVKLTIAGVERRLTTNGDGFLCLSDPVGTAGQVKVGAIHETRAGDATTTLSGAHFGCGASGP